MKNHVIVNRISQNTLCSLTNQLSYFRCRDYLNNSLSFTLLKLKFRKKYGHGTLELSPPICKMKTRKICCPGCPMRSYDRSSKSCLLILDQKYLRMYYGIISALHYPRVLWPKETYPMVHTCVTMWVSVMRWVSWATSFKMSFSRRLWDNLGVLTLRLHPLVKNWNMHPRSILVSINDLAWTREIHCLDKTWIDGCSKCSNDMNAT